MNHIVSDYWKRIMLRVLELFSGMGGMHCALDLADLNYEIIAAIDINPTANLVYASCFPDVPLVNRSIETIPLHQWEKWRADVWLMSPPCQPFTRQGKQGDLSDRRTDGFVHLMKTVLPQLTYRPRYILLENVSGFERSQARDLLLETLQAHHYYAQQYLLSPIQFGIPNSRLRYYLIASQRDNAPFDSSIQTRIGQFDRLHDKLRLQFPKQDTSLTTGTLRNDQITEQCSLSSDILVDRDHIMAIKDFLVTDENSQYELDDEQHKRGAHVTDIVSCYAQRSFCFTKSYAKYFEGTGSLLSTSSGRLRFFTPKEIANLHCFPLSYRFPDQITARQAYALLGNSLNVFVIAVLLENLFERS